MKILIADDSPFYRTVLKNLLGEIKDINIVGEASNGVECIAKIKELNPDLVTLDIDMPYMNGMEVLEELKTWSQKPVIIILSAFTHDGGALTLEALSKGAVDFIDKSTFNITDLAKLKLTLIDKITVWRHEEKASTEKIQTKIKSSSYRIDWRKFSICIIGASTGGPPALEKIVKKVHPDFSVPIVIVQHMPEGFTAALAQRLNNMSSIEVKEAENGESLSPGKILIAPSGMEFTFTTYRTVNLKKIETTKRHIPSIDTAMTTSLEAWEGKKIVGILLTGMGRDGAVGLKKIYDAGGLTIAEHESSCVVYGMPRAAYLADAVRKMLPIDHIANLFEISEQINN